MNLGIDVSDNNGHINWPLVARTGVSLCMVKVSQGVAHVDEFALANIKGAQAAGLIVGAYHYWQPSLFDPDIEAKHFSDTLLQLPSVTLTAIDVEDPDVSPGSQLATACGVILARSEHLTGHTPRLYTSRGYIADHGLASIDNAAHYPLWLAAWTTVEPSTPRPWSRVNGWQFAAEVPWPGISGVDLSIWVY